MLARTLLPFLALLPLGCTLSTEPGQDRDPALRLDPGMEVVFRAEHPRYSQGDTATITLRNGTDRTLGYNLCSSARELRAEGEWRRFVPFRICTAALYPLEPGEETVLREPITAEWRPGEYRMVTTVVVLETDNHGEVFTPPFTVGR